MAGLIKAGKREEALQIIQSMTAGEFGDGVVPGLNVYNAMVMSHVVSSEWHDALSVYDTIRQLNITPDKTTLQGLLIACNRIGDRARALDLLTEFLQGNMTMDKICFEHCLKVLIPKEVRASSIGDVRARLRAYGTRHSAFKQSATNLSRSLRLAEIEDDRQESERISELDLQGRRAKAWRDVIKKTIEFSQLVQNGQNKAVNGTNG
jgi:pentatricopeptide repeat protein